MQWLSLAKTERKRRRVEVSASSNRQTIGAERNSIDSFNLRAGRGGLDTVSIVWRFKSEKARAVFDLVAASEKSRVGKIGRAEDFRGDEGVKYKHQRHGNIQLTNPLDSGGRVGLNLRHYAIRVEGRAMALLSGDENNRELCPAFRLDEVAARAASDIAKRLGFDSSLFNHAAPGLRRLDIASDVVAEPFYGLTVLRALSGVLFSNQRPTSTWRRQGRVETVAMHDKSRRIRARVYDKAAESGQLQPGSLLRFERQVRFAKDKQPSITTGTQTDLAEIWKEGFKPWLQLAEGLRLNELRAYSVNQASDQILKLAEAGEIKPAKAERLCGALQIRQTRGEQWWSEFVSRDAGYRRMRELRELGIVISPTEKAIDLGEVFDTARIAIDGTMIEAVEDFRGKKEELDPLGLPWRKAA